jgi:hypothetical protein
VQTFFFIILLYLTTFQVSFNPDSILQNDDEDIPSWTYNNYSPEININLSNIKTSSNSPEHCKQKFIEIKEEHEDFIHIYTDGSKEGCKVGAAVFENYFTSSMRLPGKASILLLKQKL